MFRSLLYIGHSHLSASGPKLAIHQISVNTRSRYFAVNQRASGNVCFDYITAKGNRLVAVSEDDRCNKRFVAVDELEFA